MAASGGGSPGRIESAAALVLAAVLLLSGALVWLVLRQQPGALPLPADIGPLAADAAATDTLQSSEAGAGAAEEGAPSQEGAAGGAVVEEAPPDERREPPVIAERSARHPSRGKPPGLLTGRILDPAGRPIAGARVLASLGGGCWPLDAAGPPDAPPVIASLAGDDGVFELSVKGGGPLRVAVRAPGFAATDLEALWLLDGEQKSLGVLHLPHAVVVHGVVGVRRPVEEGTVLALDDALHGPWRALGAAMGRPAAVIERGHFRVDSLPPGRWRLIVLAPGFAPAYVEGFTFAGSSERVLVDLEPELPLEFPLPQLLEQGARHVAAWRLDGTPPLRLWECPPEIVPHGLAAFGFAAAEADRLVLRGQPAAALLELRALAPADDPMGDNAFARPRTLRNEGGEVELQRLQSAALRLEVRRTFEDTPVERFTLRLPGARHTVPEEPRSWSGGRVLLPEVRPRGAPRLSREGEVLDGGPFSLAIEADGYDLARIDDLRLAPGQELDLARLYLRPLPYLHVRVVDPGGAPLAGAELWLQGVEGGVFARCESRARSGADGRARLTTLAGGGGWILVTRPGFAPLRVPAASEIGSERRPMELLLQPGGEIAVEALWSDGRPALARVLRLRTDAEWTPLQPPPLGSVLETLVDGSGEALLGDLQPGAHSVCVLPIPRLPVNAGAGTWLSVGLGPGDRTPLTLTCPPLSSLEVAPRWDDKPISDLVVRLEPGGDAFRDPYADRRRLRATLSARTDAQGRCVFDGLAPGTYSLRLEREGDWFHRREVEVGPRPTLARFDLADTRVSGLLVAPRGEPLPGEQRVELLAWRGSWGRDPSILPGATLEELDPEPIVLAAVESGEEGSEFAFPGLPIGVELELRALAGDARQPLLGERSLAGFAAGARIGSLELRLAPAAGVHVEIADRLPPAGLAVLAYNVEQPWGAGRFARELGGGSLNVQPVPGGSWRMCLARVDPRGAIVELGPWRRVVLRAGATSSVRLDWPALRQ